MRNRDAIHKNRGFVLVTVAILLVVILAFAALAADVGVLYSSRTTAQEIVDGAALAGASTFVLNPIAPQPQTAINYATAAATSQSVLGNPVVASEVTVSVAGRIVTVDLERVENTYFSRVVGLNSARVRVRGVAEASNLAVGSRCAKPFFLPNTVLLPTGTAPCDACNPAKAAYNQVLIRNGAATSFALAQIAAENQIRIRPTSPTNALAPGQYYSLAIGGTGGEVYRTNIATCAEEVVSCSQCYEVEPGNMIGPTKQGIRELIGDPADVFVHVGQYSSAAGISDTSPSLVVVPVWDVCYTNSACGEPPFCPAGKFADSGRNIQVQVVGFALIFIERTQGNDVEGRLINVVPCDPNAGGGGDETGPYAIPIRLVQSPES